MSWRRGGQEQGSRPLGPGLTGTRCHVPSVPSREPIFVLWPVPKAGRTNFKGGARRREVRALGAGRR